MTQPPYSPPSWISYGGGEAISLTIVLLVVACGFAYAGKRVHTPLRIAPPGSTVAWLLIAIWTLAVCTLGVAWSVYELQLKEAYPSFVEPRVHVHIFTIIDAVAAFFAIFYLTRRWGSKVALHSAVIGTAAAWTIFEFPFDLIVMMDQSPDPEPYDVVSAAFFSAVIPGRVLHGIAANVAAIDASDRICGLRLSRDVCGIRRLGCLRVCVPFGTVTARTQCHFENPMLRSSNHAVCLEGGWRNL